MAKSQPSDDFANIILAHLSRERQADLRPHLQSVELEIKKVIYEPNRPVACAYFVETGMISVVSTMKDGSSIEVGTIGKEGMVGGFLLLGTETVPYQYFVQIAGHGHRIDGEKLRDEASRNGELRK